jgi:hypothetical protein
MRQIFLLVISVTLKAQSQTDLTSLMRDLRTAIEGNELAKTADLAASVDDAVQFAHNAWLVRDAKTRTDEVLGYLPFDTEGFWVNQEPFTVRPDQSLQLLQQEPTLA